ncbi:hypothetical protein WJR50_06600 [Catalinimonas sp. 4WD22]|uniref:hypothetical protein n=1 Tax=Catalinimonas locisalis TaxID=3133978 RepID=UPI0031015B55
MICEPITLPPHEIIRYVLDHESGCYNLSFAPVGFNRMPFRLKVERTFNRQKIGSDMVISGSLNGKKFFTGIRPISENWFYGDQLYKGKKYLLLFQFSPDNQELRVYYNLNVYPTYKSVRAKRVEQFIQSYKIIVK